MKIDEFTQLQVLKPDDLDRWDWLDFDLVKKFDQMLVDLGLRSAPVILSTFRTKEENEAAGGAEHSMHLLGKAIDWVPPGDPLTAYYAAERVGFTGIGLILNKRGVVSMHVDNRPGGPARWSSLYGAPYGSISDVIDRLELLGYGSANKPAVGAVSLILTGLLIWYIFRRR